MSNTNENNGVPVSVVVISVENLDRSLTFYGDTLGLEITDSVLVGKNF